MSNCSGALRNSENGEMIPYVRGGIPLNGAMIPWNDGTRGWSGGVNLRSGCGIPLPRSTIAQSDGARCAVRRTNGQNAVGWWIVESRWLKSDLTRRRMANVVVGVYGLLSPFYMGLEAYMEIINKIILARGGSFLIWLLKSLGSRSQRRVITKSAFSKSFSWAQCPT